MMCEDECELSGCSLPDQNDNSPMADVVRGIMHSGASKSATKRALWVVTRAATSGATMVKSQKCSCGCKQPTAGVVVDAAQYAHEELCEVLDVPFHSLAIALKRSGGCLSLPLQRKLKHLSTAASALRHITKTAIAKLMLQLDDEVAALKDGKLKYGMFGGDEMGSGKMWGEVEKQHVAAIAAKRLTILNCCTKFAYGSENHNDSWMPGHDAAAGAANILKIGIEHVECDLSSELMPDGVDLPVAPAIVFTAGDEVDRVMLGVRSRMAAMDTEVASVGPDMVKFWKSSEVVCEYDLCESLYTLAECDDWQPKDFYDSAATVHGYLDKMNNDLSQPG